MSHHGTTAPNLGLPRLITLLGGFLLILISIGLIYFGSVSISRRQVLSGTAIATIQPGSTCSSTYGNKYNCELNITYAVAGVAYTNRIFTTTLHNYIPGDTLTISYDPNNPQNATIYQAPPNKTFGIIILIIGIAMLILTLFGMWFIYWITNPVRLEAFYEKTREALIKPTKS